MNVNYVASNKIKYCERIRHDCLPMRFCADEKTMLDYFQKYLLELDEKNQKNLD